jgi:uncharacterized protein involved in exopolysaccharide biosynthesis
MTESIRISKAYSKPAVKQGRWEIFLVIGLIANAAIWGAALLYLKVKKPTYTSTWAVTLPGAATDANVNLPNIGQASYQNSSPYGIATQDPRQNYKFIAESEPVLKAAAAQLNLTPEKFGKPQIKLADSTTIMEFAFKGATPQEAQNKSFALYNALQLRLNHLRVQEGVQRDVGFQSALSSSKRKLEIAQKRLSDFKAGSMLNSNDQIKALSDNIEQLRRQRAEVVGQQQQASGRLEQLSTNLNLSAQQAADAFTLETDQIFQQNLKDYSSASSALVVLSSKYQSDYPAVVAEKAKQNAAQTAMLDRAQSLLGRPVSQATLQQLNINSSNSGTGRDRLFQDLVTVQSEQRGFQSQTEGINQQINQLEARLKGLAQQETTLDALQRNAQVAEAVFSSTLARLDIGRSNGFGSYPLIQLLSEPTLPKTPSSPKKEYVLLGAVLGSLFLNAGLVSLWLRRRQLLYKQERNLKTLENLHQFPGFGDRAEGHFRETRIAPGSKIHETPDA